MNKINIIVLFLLFLTSMYCPTMAQFDSCDMAYMTQKTEQMEQLFTNRGLSIYTDGRDNPKLEWFKKCNADIFSVLDELYLERNQEIHIDVKKARGQCSYLCLQNGEYIDEQQLMKNVHLKEFSTKSCWQWVLLYHILHFFPYGVHYFNRVNFVNTDEEWASVVLRCKDDVIPDSVWAFEEHVCSAIPQYQYEEMKAFKIQPSPIVLIDREQNLVHVRFFGWNRWSGLSEKHMYLKIIANKQLEVLKYDSRVIFEHSEGLF